MTNSTKVRSLGSATTTIPPLAPIYICIAGFCLSLVLNYPGFMSYDSAAQIIEARAGVYSDWHPPIMAFIWHFADKIIPGPFGMLLLGTTLIWVGTCLISLHWFADSRSKWLMLAPCLLVFYPPIFSISGAIWKDIFMWAFLTGAIGVASSIKPNAARNPRLLCTFLLLLFGALLFRYNAVFAVVPIIALGIVQAFPGTGTGTGTGTGSARRITGAVLLAVLVVVVMLFCVKAVNDAIASSKCTPWAQVALFDIAGTIHSLSDVKQQEALFELVPPYVREQSSLKIVLQSYSPRECGTLFDDNHPVFRMDGMTQADVSQLKRAWYEAVFHHPLAWLRHRRHFFCHLIGLTPESLASAVYMEPHGYPAIFEKEYPDKTHRLNRVQAYVQAVLQSLSKQLIFRPWIYLALAVFVLIPCFDARLPNRVAIALIAVSGIAHELGLLIVGPSPDFRYSHYLIYASMLSALILLRAQLSRAPVSHLISQHRFPSDASPRKP